MSRQKTQRPDQLQVASGAVTVLLAIGFVVLLWMTAGAVLGIVLLLLSPLWIVNVALGGGFDDSPLDGIGRWRRFRSDPSNFFHRSA
jgi:fatty acid desaturase